MSNKNMCANISNSRLVKNGYLLRLSALMSEVTLLTTIITLELCLVLFSTLVLLALCYLAFSRLKVTRFFGIPPLSIAFRLECLLLPRLGNKEDVLVHPHVFRLKLEMTRNISKSLDILTVSKQASFTLSRIRQ